MIPDDKILESIAEKVREKLGLVKFSKQTHGFVISPWLVRTILQTYQEIRYTDYNEID